MVFMEWNDELATGIDLVDTQHRWLVDLTNQLHEALSDTTPQQGLIGEILENLMDYTMNHFIAEEDLFQRHGYPGAAAHQELHNRFTATALDLLQRHESGAAVGIEVLDFLKTWLIRHIMGNDKEYTPFLLANGVR